MYGFSLLLRKTAVDFVICDLGSIIDRDLEIEMEKQSSCSRPQHSWDEALMMIMN